MRKIITTLGIIFSTLVVSACWFTESNFNATYIASVNGSATHYEHVSSISEATYKHGQKVDLPITVQVKVSNLFIEQDSSTRKIKNAVLQYKIVKKDGSETNFITVKSIENPNWALNFDHPINLFGAEGIIDISEEKIEEGDQIIIRVWLSDGVFENGDINSSISSEEIPDIQSYGEKNIDIGNDGWQAPHVFKVIYSGKRRPMI